MRARSGVGRQFAKFLLVGLGNTVVSFAAYDVLLAVTVPYPAAAGLAFAAGAVNGYLLNRAWTFRARDTTRARMRYVAVQAGGLALTAGLLSLLVHTGRLGEVAGYAAALPLVTTATFAANRLWVFTTNAKVAHRELQPAPATLRASTGTGRRR
jgi:putative flippase GtrA